MFGHWIKRLVQRLRPLRDERGISTLDWIGLTAVILTFLTAIVVYGQTAGGRQLGAAMASGLRCQIMAWDHGGRCSGGGSYRYGQGHTPSGFNASSDFSGGGGLSGGGATGSWSESSSQGQSWVGEAWNGLISPAKSSAGKAGGLFDSVKSFFFGLFGRKPATIGDVKDALKPSGTGKRLLKVLQDNDVQVQFGSSELKGMKDAQAYYDPLTNRIVVNEKLKWDKKEELAEILAHEAQHAEQAVRRGIDHKQVKQDRALSPEDLEKKRKQSLKNYFAQFDKNNRRSAATKMAKAALDEEVEAYTTQYQVRLELEVKPIPKLLSDTKKFRQHLWDGGYRKYYEETYGVSLPKEAP